MDTGIGTTLRDARNRRRLDIAEVEQATRIRPRFLLAMENEDWDALPGGAYTRSFIRTYASYLGLDGPRLAEEYRRASGEPRPGERGAPRAEPVVASDSPGGGPWLSRGAWATLVSVLLIAALVVVGLSGGDENRSEAPKERKAKSSPATRSAATYPGTPEISRSGTGIFRLEATGEVWVCLLGADGEELIDGEVLAAGAEEGPFRSGSFTLSFGNGEVSMWIDGQQASIPETPNPVGYAIDEGGELIPLPEAERPTCT
ncbi:MAG TPA: helix-turn-helix domain-containing protein [Solirubrobacterales bacterium]|nr:helix-turn-helix domain-containing protein [Solirubrobacterales bacterium]